MQKTYNPKITVIEPTKDIYSKPLSDESKNKRVAAYARVSTDDEEQINSYIAQVEYYTDYINGHENWTMVEVYADEGKSGTNRKKRKNFNRMIQDAKDGKIDIILTKSISRFARNTLDAVAITRELRAIGVAVIFDNEHLNSLDRDAESRLTIFASMAQEESHTISDNVKFGQRKRMREGKVSIPKHMLALANDKDGNIIVKKDEAEIVTEIYRLFLDGKTIRNIARILTERGIPTPKGQKNWSDATIKSILSNEKYKGSVLTQKHFVANYLTKEVRKNTGELEQYLFEFHHEAIIPPSTYDLVQFELERRKNARGPLNNKSPLSNKIYCSECGAYYGHKVWSGKNFWCCNDKYDHQKNHCATPNLREEIILTGFIIAFNKILAHKADYLAVYEDKLSKPDKSLAKNEMRQEELITNIENNRNSAFKLLQQNGMMRISNEDYESQRKLLLGLIEKDKAELEELQFKYLETSAARERLRNYTIALKTCGDKLTSFDDFIWSNTVKKVIVNPDSLTYEFWDDTPVRIKLDELSNYPKIA